jgi:hypothetical protein
MNSIKRLFRVFDDGAVFKWIVVVLFALCALATLFKAVKQDYAVLKLLKHASFFDGVGWIVLAGGFLLASLFQVAILLYRGTYEVSQIKLPRYSLLALVAKAIRALSESYLLLYLVLAPFGCLATWLGGLDVIANIPFPNFTPWAVLIARNAFFTGLYVLVFGIALALGQLVVSYFVAEFIEAFSAIATDVAAIRQGKEGKRASHA